MPEYEIRSHLDLGNENKLLKKLECAELCPYHSIKPEIVGPRRFICAKRCEHCYNIPDYLDMQEFAGIWFKDAILFPDISWTCFCVKCAISNPTPEKHNKFGYGLSSQYSWNAAVNNWNKSCSRHYVHLVKDDLKVST